ncbi:MAG: NAD-dependent epimerase/dehydratase family protein [Candidatus Aenigmarchaeota archaeon]|nr:NAD-dependent epimerase/dehydratase family protein [Candidatus Aenigmarchaeota archaeon]
MKRALNRGHRVKALVRRTSPYQALEVDNVELVFGDLADGKSLRNACSNVDVIYNAAGLLGKWGVPAQQLHEVNVEGVKNLIEACIDTEPQYSLHLSAGGVTGPMRSHVADESYECRPSTTYEKTKLRGEQLALEMADKYGVPLSVVRPTFTYGPGDPHKFPLFKMVKKRAFVFIGNGMSTVHPVYIDDLIEGIEIVGEQQPRGEIYIIGGDRPVTKRELIYTIADVLEVPRPKTHIPIALASLAARILEPAGKAFKFEPPLTSSRIVMMTKNWGMSIEKAKRELGYKPKVDLLEGVRRTVAWYRRNNYL